MIEVSNNQPRSETSRIVVPREIAVQVSLASKAMNDGDIVPECRKEPAHHWDVRPAFNGNCDRRHGASVSK
jgi:hypothetical protein